ETKERVGTRLRAETSRLGSENRAARELPLRSGEPADVEEKCPKAHVRLHQQCTIAERLDGWEDAPQLVDGDVGGAVEMRPKRRVFEHLLHEEAWITDSTDDGLALLEASARIRGSSLLPVDVREGDERLAAEIRPLQDERLALDLDELCRRLAELAEGLLDQASAQPQPEPLLAVARAQHIERSRVEAFGLAEALAALRSLARTRECLRRGGHRRDHRRPPDLAHEPARLLEVIRDDLDVLILRTGESRDPSGDAGVERCASGLGQLTVRDVPDEDVLEGVLVLSFDGRCRGGLDEISARER